MALRARAAAALSTSETAGRYSLGMDTLDTAKPEQGPVPTKLAPGYSHLLLRDTRTPEEKLAASLKESARRKGRGAFEVVGEGKRKRPRVSEA